MRSMAIANGDGYSVGHLDDLGEGPGFRKIRPELDVTEFGVNAIVLPAGIETGFHMHDRQQELYFVHSGRVEIEFTDGEVHELGAPARSSEAGSEGRSRGRPPLRPLVQ